MDKIKAIAGGGAWMIAAAFQIIPNTWPNLIRPHPWIVGIFVLTGAAMFIYAAVGHKQSSGPVIKQETSGSNSPMGGSGTTSGGDLKQMNAENALDAGGDAIGNKQIKVEGDYHHHDAPGHPVAVRYAQPPPPKRQRPNLIGLAPKSVPFTDGFLIPGQNQRKPLEVLPIENRIGRTVPARQLCASIRFNTSEEDYVKKAYWLGEFGYLMDISNGDIASVVIGQFAEDRLYYFDNPRPYPVEWGRQYDFDSKPNPSHITVPPDGINAVVTIYPDKGNPFLAIKLFIAASGTIARVK